MLLSIFQTALSEQNLILGNNPTDSCYSEQEKKIIATIIIENHFLKEQDSLKDIVISKYEEKISYADSIIPKQKSILFLQEEELKIADDEIIRANLLLKETKKKRLVEKIFGGLCITGLFTFTGTLTWLIITRR
jgi:hypothetical protein